MQMNTGIINEKTAYGRLVNEISQLIADGKVDSNGFIASEHELGRTYGVSRVTVRKATDILIDQGLIERRPGKGLYVYNPVEKKTRHVWVILDNLAREHCVWLARGVQKWSSEYDYKVELKDGHAEMEQNLLLLNQLLESDEADGAIIMTWYSPEFFEALCRLKDKGLPFVVVDYHTQQLRFPCVAADNYHGGRMVAEHLYEACHRRYGFIGDYTSITVQRRLEGYRDYLAERGLPLAHAYVSDVRPEDRFKDWASLIDGKMEKLFDEPNPPTALFVSCDYLARSVYRWCERHNITIPNDLSVVGFDNEPSCNWLTPELTTIAQPFMEMGDAAMRLLHSQLEGHPWNGRDVILPVQLITRKSVKTLTPVK